MGKNTSSLLIGVEYEIEISAKNSITIIFIIYVYFERSPTFLFISEVIWCIDIIDDYLFVI